MVVAIPMLGRPHHVTPLLDSLDSTAPGCRVVFACTPGDDDVIDVVLRAGREMVVVPKLSRGDYARKINTVIAGTMEPLVFLGASDILFHPGWFEAATAMISQGIGVVGTNDLGSPRVIAGEHSTHSLVTREYCARGTVDDPTILLHEGYPHEWVDDEFVLTARARGAYAHAYDAHVEHLHPDWGKGEMDPTYEGQRLRMRRGRGAFARRRRLWEAL